MSHLKLSNPFPIEDVRSRFPALGVGDRVYFDGPGGTQVCTPAIDAMTRHLTGGTANLGGDYTTSRDTGALSDAARAAMADLLGAQAQDIAFGPNMTSLTLAVSRALAQDWSEGDELIVSRLDHDANVAPWLLVARDRGMVVRWIDFDPDTGLLDLDALPDLIRPRTRLVAVGAASNAIGTINDVARVAAIAKAGSDALVFVDAVQSVPHLVTDVTTLACDILVCSPYKFFGPHQGVLWARPGVLDDRHWYKLRPASATPPVRALETGTQSFEGQAAVLGTIDYLDWLGGRVMPGANDRRTRLMAAMGASRAYEDTLGERLIAGLRGLPGGRLWGRPTMAGRVPTFGITVDGHHARDLAIGLGERGIFVWAGSFYAVEAIARMGLTDAGGLLRIGLCHYSTDGEVDRAIEALGHLIA